MVFKGYFYRSICLWIANYLFPYPKNLKVWEKKNAWLRRAGIQIGKGVAIGKGLFCLPMHEQNIEINDSVAIGYNVRLYAFNRIEIGTYTMIAADVLISNGGHDKSNFSPFSGPLKIGNGCWIGTGSKLIGQIKIGNNAIVGAGSVIVRDIPEGAIVVGVPGRIIGYRKLSDKVWHFGDTWYSPYTFSDV